MFPDLATSVLVVHFLLLSKVTYEVNQCEEDSDEVVPNGGRMQYEQMTISSMSISTCTAILLLQPKPPLFIRTKSDNTGNGTMNSASVG